MKRSTLIAVAVFAVLLIAFFATREPQVSVGMHRFVVAPVTTDAIDSIDLGKGNIVLTRTDNGWTLTSSTRPGKKYAADKNVAQQLVTALVDVKAPDFITARPEKLAELELDDVKGIALKAKQRDLVLGKTAKNGGGYLRLGSSSEVYVTLSPLPWLAHRTFFDFRDKTIATLPGADAVAKLSVTPAEGGGSSFMLTNENGKWAAASPLPKDFRLDQDAVARLVTTLTSLQAADYSENETVEAQGLAAPWGFVLQGKDGKTVSLKLGSKRPDGKRALTVEGDPDGTVALLAGFTADQLASGLEGLRDLRPFELDASKAVKVVVTAGGKKTVAQKDGTSWKVTEPATLPAGFDFDMQQVTSLLNRMGNQRALRLAAPGAEAKANVKSPTASVEVTFEGNVTKKLAYGAQADAATEVYVLGADGLLYVAAMAEKTALEQGLDLFKRPPQHRMGPPQGMPQGMGQGMTSLDQLPPEIRAQIEAQLRAQGQ